MIFWLICVLMALALTLWLVRPLLKAQPGAAAGGEDVVIFRDQLATLDADIARGAIAADEAEATRTELSRRLLAAA
ncbi:c-type cytochrome biogenesis protein CcmI, partial [Roseobacter sp. HKCCA0434]|uniref:c-type cytochrome biogenesis protein CcmI n=1 Tax=Roseobacter sp. HKCCA0434 TaxID=3079297 RepID=UPI002905857A